jgi:hypothetical protein
MKLLFYFVLFSVFAGYYPFYTFVLIWGMVWIVFVALCWDMGVELMRIRARQKIEQQAES